MCGLAGCLDLRRERPVERETVVRMADTLVHRGPDSDGAFVEGSVGLGFRRLSIVDLAGGDQPILNEDGSLVLLCNGEIFNQRELRHELAQRGHVFRTESDVEVILHLYEEVGTDLLARLEGQFAFALYDRREDRLLLARDRFGICPLHWAVFDGWFLFGSEIKSILRHPRAVREVDLTGLDQVFSFPGLVSPTTLFRGVSSLPGGHYLVVGKDSVREGEYWDLDYPMAEDLEERAEEEWAEALAERFDASVRRRLQADVPVGFYLSGGLDSSLIAATIHRLSNERRCSFSITFPDEERNEAEYQRLVAADVGSEHHEIPFPWSEIVGRLPEMVRHAECAVKESYNTCSLALSAAARAAGIPVILTGEGADELFAGYVGYRFDHFGLRRNGANGSGMDLDALLEEEVSEQLWGDPHLFYEQEQVPLRELKSALWSPAVAELYPDFDCLERPLVNPERLRGRHPIHQRSYLDVKLRLSDHLLSDHGDRMALANSVEARYPFLDGDLVALATRIPPGLKLKGFEEKYLVRKVAEGRVPRRILEREKYGFNAPGSAWLLRQEDEWLGDLLSPERIRRQGYFDPAAVERLKSQYLRPGFRLNLPFESDLLMVILTFGLFLDVFDMPAVG
jgi:asparagine synthase (glutamine-hydrolysing)